MVERLFLLVPRGCLQFVIVVFPNHTHLLFLKNMCQLFFMRNPYMTFQNCILINFEWTHGWMDGPTHRQAQSNMPLQLFQSWRHNEGTFTLRYKPKFSTDLSLWTTHFFVSITSSVSRYCLHTAINESLAI